MIIDGRVIARRMLERLKRFKTKKTFAAILVGRDPASLYFLKQQKERAAKELGISFALHQLPGTVSRAKLYQKIRELNNDPEVGGMVLQLPLPKRFDRDGAVRLIDERKDVDGLNFPGLVLPPAVSVVQKILKEAEVRHLDGKRVAIIGRGFLVGRPVAEWLTGRVKKLTVFHRGFFPKPLLKEADIVISGIGRPRYIRSAWIKRNAVLIDFGYARTNGRITGDFDLEPCEKKAAFITPTPGGTGPILVAQLFENFFKLVRMQK